MFNLDEPGQKSTRIEIYKKISNQPAPNPWWVGLARRFQPILTALLVVKGFQQKQGFDFTKIFSPAVKMTIPSELSWV